MAKEASRNSYGNTRDALVLHYESRPPKLVLDDLKQDDRVGRACENHLSEEIEEHSVRRRTTQRLILPEAVTEVTACVDELHDYSVDIDRLAGPVVNINTIAVLLSDILKGGRLHHKQEPHAVQHAKSNTPPPTPPPRHDLQSRADDMARSGRDNAYYPAPLAIDVFSATARSNTLDSGTSMSPALLSNDRSITDMASEGISYRQNGPTVLQHQSSMVSDASASKAKLPPWSLAGYMSLFTAAATKATRTLSFCTEQSINDLPDDDLAHGAIE